MRAEMQNTVAAIEKSLALLAQRMDRETAPHRLEEFNARVEDPTLWDDPEAAQKLMRERQMLLDAMTGYDSIQTGAVRQHRADRDGRDGSRMPRSSQRPKRR